MKKNMFLIFLSSLMLLSGCSNKDDDGKIKVTFKNYDGKVLFTDYINDGENAVYEGDTPLKAEDEKYAYKFIGWNKPLDNISSNCEIIAQYKIDYNIDLDFVLDELTNTYTVSKYKGKSNQIYIPDYYHQLPVTKIEKSAFSNKTEINEVTLGSKITNIGNFAFSNCSSLLNLYYDGTIENWCNVVFESAFSNPMYYAKYFYLLDENNNYNEVSEVVIPDSLSKIGNYQFYGFFNLSSIVITSTIESIGWDAFVNCNKLYEIYNLSKIDIQKGLSGLNYFLVIHESLDEQSIIIDDGLFKYVNLEDNYYLISYLGKEENIVLNDNINGHSYGIYDYTFSGLDYVKSIKISSTTSSFGWWCFKNCESLEYIVIPESVKKIGNYAFYGCYKLNIYCEVEDALDSWDINWNYSNRDVYYKNQWEYKNNKPIKKDA